jgi:hypothetical protein
MENKVIAGKKDSTSDDKVADIYLRPKRDAHVRIGKNYQASIPEVKLENSSTSDNNIKLSENDNSHSEKIEDLDYISEEYCSVEEDIEIEYSNKPNKKRRIER